jgi:hypothetical protein
MQAIEFFFLVNYLGVPNTIGGTKEGVFVIFLGYIDHASSNDPWSFRHLGPILGPN